MARLGWDNVAAPDFSGASNGIQSAASMITQALRGAEGGVKEYNNILDGNVNRAFALELLKYQDPESYKTALAAGSIPGQDSHRLSAESIGAAGTRYNTLLGQAQTEFQMGRDKRIDGQAQAFDAAAPIIAQARALLGANKEAEANALLAQHPEVFKGLGARDALSVADGNLDSLRDGLGIVSTRQGITQNSQRFDREKMGWTTEDAADVAYQEVLGNANDQQSADAYIRSRGYAPKVEALIRGKLGLPNFVTYDVGDPLLGIGGSGGSGGEITFAAPQQAVASALKSGGLSDNVVAGFLGNFHVEGGYGGAQGDGGSAGGIAQWRNERRVNFQKVIGVDPTKATADQQAKFVLWELNNPAAAGMTPAQAQAIKNAKSPAEAAALIDQYFERSDGKARSGRAAAATNYAEILLGKASNNAVQVVDDSNTRAKIGSDSNYATFAKTQADETPIAVIVENLRKTAFPSASKDTILSKIADVKTRAAARGAPTLSDATAADILARSIRGAPGFLERAGTMISGSGGIGGIVAAALGGGGDMGDNTSINYSIVDKMIEDAKPRNQANGAVQSNNQVAASGRAMMDTQVQGLNRAKDALAKIDAKIVQVEAANAAGRRVSAGNLYAQKQQAEQIIQDLTVALRPKPQAPQPRQNPVWPSSPVAVARPVRTQVPKGPPKPGWSLTR